MAIDGLQRQRVDKITPFQLLEFNVHGFAP